MKKFLPYILIVFTLVNFLAPVSIGLSEKNRVVVEKNIAKAVDTCIIKNFSFSPKGGPDTIIPDVVSINLNTENCIGKRIIINLTELSGIDEVVYNISRDNNYKLLQNDLVFNLTPTEKSCKDGKCRIGFYVALHDIDSGLMMANYSSENADVEKELDYNCKTNPCKENDTNWIKSNSDGDPSFQAETATVWRDFAMTDKSIIVSGGEQITGPLKITKDKIDPQDSVSIAIYNDDGTPVSKEILGENNPVVINANLLLDTNGVFNYKKEFTGLTPETSYTISITPNFKNFPYLNIENKTPKVFTRNKDGQIIAPTPGKTTSDSQEIPKSPDTMPDCSIIPMRMGGCFAQLIYYALFVPTSYIFALAGNFFDWTFAYSVNDASYRSGFVVQGWGVVRDFCNMFFIFVLLYVAFTTILGTNSAKTKEMIVNVVIIGLLINFSLFATQVIIDASNILARVFYNSNTIVITPGGVTNGEMSGNTTGVIPLSAALVNKVNPQNIIINANKVNDFQKESNIGSAQNATNDQSLSAGKFIIVTLLATIINVIGFLVFLSVALIFIARVIGLWIAMILSPFVFFTYMVPSLDTMEMVGWKKWWPETIKLAFLAPVFIFFLYIILKFLQTDLVFMSHTANETGIQMVIATIVPFAFIMILLDQAKNIAKKMSGTIGQQVTDGLSKAGGLALGVATGGAALAGRATLGRLGNVVANSERLKKYEAKGGFGGTALRNLGSAAGKGSFDVRNTKGGQQFSKQTGMNMDNGSWVGAGKEKGKGGFAQARADKTAARIKRSKELEVGQDSKLTKDLRVAQVDEKKLLDANAPQLKKADKDIATAKEDRDNANAALQANPIDKNTATQQEKDAHKILEDTASKANAKYKEETQKKKDIRGGSAKTDAPLNSDGTSQYNTNNGNISTSELKRALQEATEAMQNLQKSEAALAVATQKVKDHPTQENIDALKVARSNHAENIMKDRKAQTTKASALTSASREGGAGKSLAELQTEDIPNAQNAIEKENNTRKTNFAEYIGKSKFNKTKNLLSTGLVHSLNGDAEASHRIMMDAKE